MTKHARSSFLLTTLVAAMSVAGVAAANAHDGRATHHHCPAHYFSGRHGGHRLLSGGHLFSVDHVTTCFFHCFLNSSWNFTCFTITETYFTCAITNYS